MKRSVGALVTLAALLFLFSPRGVGAAPIAPCPGYPEDLRLLPLEVFADGVLLARAAATGRYVTDAGMEFDVDGIHVMPLTGVIEMACIQPSTKVSVEVIDPFSGASHRITMEQAP